MTTLVATLALNVSDARSRRQLLALRASHGDLENQSTADIALAVGQTRTFVATRFFYAHIRDVVDVTFTDADNNTTTWLAVTGILALPFPVTVTLAVNSSSTIVLNRAIKLVYS